MEDYRQWRHVFKIDPARPLDDASLEAICESGTDAVIVGGTDGITRENTLQMLARIRRFFVPCALEISELAAVTPGFDKYFIPTVLNSRSADWIVGRHHKAIKQYDGLLKWDEIVMEGYCILNPNAQAARLTEARTDLETRDVEAFAEMAEHMLSLPVFYLEYSGTYGDPDLVAAVKKRIKRTRLFYGGGVDNASKAKEMAALADTVIVGNVIYENIHRALQTVEAVKKVSRPD